MVAVGDPLTLESWIRLDAPTRLTGRSSRDLHAAEQLLPALAEFHRLALDAERFNRRLSFVDEANLQVSRTSRRRHDAASARRELFGVLAGDLPAADTVEALHAALKSIGTYEGIDFRFPDELDVSRTVGSSLQDILHASGVRCRQVRLADDDRWWRGDSGALLAFRRADGQPVALLPGGWGRYRLVDPGSGRSARVTRERAAALAPEAWCFYPPLRPDNPAGAAPCCGSPPASASRSVSGPSAGLARRHGVLTRPCAACSRLVIRRGRRRAGADHGGPGRAGRDRHTAADAAGRGADADRGTCRGPARGGDVGSPVGVVQEVLRAFHAR